MAGRSLRYLDLPRYNQGTIFGPTSAPVQSIFETSATQEHRLGARYIDGDRVFRYAKNSSAGTLSKALMTQTQVVETKSHEIVQTGHTWAVGDISGTVLVTTGGAFVDNEFTDGWMLANKVAAVGDIYRILANDDTTTTILNIEIETPIRTAISATTEVSLIPNRWYDIVAFPTAHTGYATGVPLVDIAASYYGWVQTAGPCPLIVDTAETVVIGDSVGNPAACAVAGACGVRVTLEQAWGNVLLVGAAAEPAIVNLGIDA
jgi:hypothetical protein